jgi:uncharacterized RDD family membrane protein YckC
MSAATSQHRRAPATAHGVRRVVAALIDAVLVPAVVLGTAELAWWTGALGLAGVTEAGWVMWSRSYPLVAWAVTGAAFAYHGVSAARWGRTVGKRAMGLAIVTDDAGNRPGVALSLWRAAWSAAIFAPTILAPAVVVVGWAGVSTASHRSLADRAAGTLVVRVDGERLGRRSPHAAAATGRGRA